MTINYLFMQILYWIVFCSLFAFANTFLSYKGFHIAQIGYVLSIASIISVISQPYITKLMYKVKNFNLKFNILFTTMIMLICYITTIFTHSHLVIYIAYTIALVALFNIQTYMYPFIFEYIHAGYKVNFGLARGMGSIAYAFASYFIALLSTRFLNLTFIAFIGIFCTTLLLISIFTFKTLKKEKINQEDNFTLKQFYDKYKKFSFLLIGLIFIFTTHNILNSFMKNIIENLNYGTYEVGIAYTLASAIELPIMLLLPIISKRYRYSNLFKITSIGFTLKASLTLIASLSSNLYILYLAQLTQSLGFALYLPVSLYYTSEILEKEDVVKGQTFLGMALTLGGILGNFIGGNILEYSSVINLLTTISILSLIGTIFIILNTENKNK